ncbi:MAG: glutathione S-transferase family protein [Proteobacteria bacterium]|nr:glutathione S-transferase family protein [Pseudomonadota bacterium]
MPIQLYDLAGAEDARRFSPFCWRIRMALAHKDLAVETIPWRFTEKAKIAFSGQELVPVIVDGGRAIADSWAIACYLETAYRESPSLFGGGAGEALTRFVAQWVAAAIQRGLFPMLALDIYDRLHEMDKAYFRRTREQRLGTSLEAAATDRDRRVVGFRDSLAPVRLMLKEQPYLGGPAPLYADYVLFGAFQWARCVSPFRLLEDGDPVGAWRERMLDLFDGLARRAPGYV